jgi:hypothetical protein
LRFKPLSTLSKIIMSDLSKTEIEQLTQLLKKLEPGFLPLDVFMQIARLTVLSIIEFVPMRMNDGKVEVLLLSREADDPLWPNELHVPGTVIRPTDTEGNIYKAFERILNDELKGTESSSPHYVGSNLHPSKRGMEQAQIYWVEVTGEPTIGQFHVVDELPSNVIESQLNFIKLAAKSFAAAKS